jgi:site-specific recombinase XerD
MPRTFERPKKSGIWWIDYTDALGGRYRKKVGGKKDAEAELQRRQGAPYMPSGRRLTFRQLAIAALADKKIRLARLSYETDVGRLGKLYPYIGDVPVEQIQPARVEDVLKDLLKTVTRSTVMRYRSLLSSVWAFGIRAGIVTVNPVKGTMRFKEDPNRDRFLTPQEERALRAAITDRTHLAEFDLALHTGMRRGEQFMLRWKDCNPRSKVLTVNGKTGQRHLPVNRTARAALRYLKRITGKGEFVTPGASAEATRDWRRWLEAAVKAAGVSNFHWHDLRHTFASRLVERGVDMPTVKGLLGHQSIVTTMRYAHHSAGHSHAAVEKLN